MADKLKVLFLGTRGFPNVQGGVEKHCQNLTVSLVQEDCDVTVFTRKPYVDPSIKYFRGVKLVSLPAVKSKSLEAFLHTLIGVLAAVWYKPDILHIQGIGPAIFTPLAKFLGMKVVVTSHGSNYEHLKWGKVAKIVLRIGERFGVCKSNQIISVSNTITEEIKTKYNIDAVTIPNGVIIHKSISTTEALTKYALAKDKYILSVGRLVPEKGFEILIDSFQEANLRDWKLVLVGQADHKDTYSLNLKKKAKKNNNIILTGFLCGKPLQELYSHAGIFVLPSFYEGLPIVLLEALSYGLSCIASDIKGNRNIALQADRFFNAGDSKDLCIKINQFINEPLSEIDRKMQISSIAEQYDWKAIARKTVTVYKGCFHDEEIGHIDRGETNTICPILKASKNIEK